MKKNNFNIRKKENLYKGGELKLDYNQKSDVIISRLKTVPDVLIGLYELFIEGSGKVLKKLNYSKIPKNLYKSTDIQLELKYIKGTIIYETLNNINEYLINLKKNIYNSFKEKKDLKYLHSEILDLYRLHAEGELNIKVAKLNLKHLTKFLNITMEIIIGNVTDISNHKKNSIKNFYKKSMLKSNQHSTQYVPQPLYQFIPPSMPPSMPSYYSNPIPPPFQPPTSNKNKNQEISDLKYRIKGLQELVGKILERGNARVNNNNGSRATTRHNGLDHVNGPYTADRLNLNEDLDTAADGHYNGDPLNGNLSSGLDRGAENYRGDSLNGGYKKKKSNNIKIKKVVKKKVVKKKVVKKKIVKKKVVKKKVVKKKVVKKK